ncbi:MAG: acyl-ACP thioesterase domain-containing protein, partial [Ilumatobacteraceae bacterium]
RTVRLGDVDPQGLVRFDTIARFLQDVASDDALDADLPNAMGWVVRRTMVRVDRPATVDEHLTSTTFCTGVGRSWAERRTSISGRDGAAIEAVSLWVQVDTSSGRPARLGPGFFERYGAAAGERVVSSRLTLDATPPPGASESIWSFRRADLDQFGHVNNAACWSVFEEVLQGVGGRRTGTAEMEYLAPSPATTPLRLVLHDGAGWLADGERTVLTFRWQPA